MGNSSGKMKVLHEEAAVVPPPAPVSSTENGTPADIENPDKIETVTAAANGDEEQHVEVKTSENTSDAETSATKKKGKSLSWLKKLSFKKDRKSKGNAEVQNATAENGVEKKEEKATEGEAVAPAVASDTNDEVKKEENNGTTSTEVKVETQAAEPVVVVENKVEETPVNVTSPPTVVESQTTPVTVVETPVTDVVVTETTTKEESEKKVEEPTSQIIEVHKEEAITTVKDDSEVEVSTPKEEIITNGHHQDEESKGDDSKEESHPIANGINGCHDDENDKPQTGDDVTTTSESLKDVAALSRDLQSLEVNH